MNAKRPPGVIARPMFANAATGSAKNITPKRLTASDRAAGANGWTCASPRSKVTLVRPSSAARIRARASIAVERSTPSASPSTAKPRALPGRLPAPAADVEHVVVRRDLRRREQVLGVRAQRLVLALLALDPDVALGAVPRLGLLHVHDLRHLAPPPGTVPCWR